MSSGKIKVLVVDDEEYIRVLIQTILDMDSSIEVVGEAKNGQEAIEMAASLNPDVITMDVQMPHMGGIEAVEAIMNQQQIPIIMVSSFTSQEMNETRVALEKGAVDFVAKFSTQLDLDIAHIATELTDKIQAWATCDADLMEKRRLENLENLENLSKIENS
ncbi:response regulator [Magnetococcales bacterium HHB-1]